MAPALILADQIIELLKAAGVTQAEATAALSIAERLVPSIPEIHVFSQDEREAIAAGESPLLL